MNVHQAENILRKAGFGVFHYKGGSARKGDEWDIMMPGFCSTARGQKELIAKAKAYASQAEEEEVKP